jgi:hypothetical protein
MYLLPLTLDHVQRVLTVERILVEVLPIMQPG